MSSEKFGIIMIGLEEDWELDDSGHRSRMISKGLSQSEDVENLLVIYCPVSIFRRGLERKTDKLSTRFELIYKSGFISVYRVNEKVSLISIVSIIPESDNILCKIERMIIAKRLKKIIEKSGIDYNLLWISNPRIIDMLPSVGYKIKIFDAIDNLLIHPQMKNLKKRIKKGYEWLINNADIIFIGSDKQGEMFRGNSDVRLLSNGVDSVFFEKNSTQPLPQDFLEIPHPIVGYCGAIQNRLDADLILEAAKKLKDCSFVFIGPVLDGDNIADLKELKNVYFMGHKKFHQIPSYISHFDVAVIPHKIDEFTESMNPLKIYEYLACGKPVVATPVNGTMQFKDQIYIAKNIGEFVHFLKVSMNDDSEAGSEKRKEAVRQFSWKLILKSCLSEIKKTHLDSK